MVTTNMSGITKIKEVKGFAILNPQWKQLNLYDGSMNRLNSNDMNVSVKPQQVQDTPPVQQVKEQHSISRA